ncbi:MAG: xanthine dehydrogenase family protein [Deltaproteobacteria bacterium]|nr:xanthine dehydrogenase family protein [Deltaproteobacteria bacterium]
MIGQNVPRTDGLAKVVGTARYIDDVPPLEGELWGVTVRSPVARGVLTKIELDPSFDWSDVTVATADDLEDPKLNPGGVNLVALIEEDQPVLAKRELRHMYEPIVLLACADRDKAERARAAVKLHIDPLPPVLSIDDALAKKHVVWGKDNVLKRYRIRRGDVDAALKDCDLVLTGTYRTHHQEQMYIEPQGVIARWFQGADGAEQLKVLGSLQCPYYVHKALKKAFALKDDHAHVEQTVTGGGFGGKEEYPSLVALHASLLSKKSGKPVRMIYGRKEDIEATTKRHPSQCTVTIGCKKDGTFVAVKVDCAMDGGAYVTLTPVVLSRGALHACGAYKFQHNAVDAVAVATSTPPNGAFRGFGAPQTIWAIERHVDAVARALGRDPEDLRRQNLFEEGDVTATGQVLSVSVGGRPCLEAATRAADWKARRANIERFNERLAREGKRVRRGLGISTFMHGGGFTGSGERRLKGKVAVDLEPGGRLRVRSASTDIGQGTETVFRQIAASASGVRIEDIAVEVPCTTNVPDSGPTVASRTVMVVGSIVAKAAAEIAERVREESKPGESFAEAGDRLLRRVGGTVSSLQQYEPPVTVAFDEETYTGDAYPCFSWMCDVAEVEVDLDTFETRVVKWWSATDVGRAIHPVLCAGQVEGGTLQAIGWALHEDLVWRPDGSIANARMTNYIVPTAVDAPPFETILVEVPFPHGPGGAKGVGELPMDGGAPAIASAIEHALAELKLPTDRALLPDLPLLPERVFERVMKETA